MKVNERHGGYVKLVRGDEGFSVNDGVTIYSRACIEISEACPERVRETIINAYAQGWVKPVAYVHESELMFDTLKGYQNADS